MQKKNYLSVLSVLSCFAVVALHINGDFWQFSKTSRWYYANWIESVFYFAVPIFFMISGATLLNYQQKYSTATFFKKRIMRTVIPFVVWSLIAWFFIKVNYPQRFEGQGIKAFINGILLAEYNQLFWYFPVLFSVYFSIPLFASVDVKKRQSTFRYLLVSTFFLNVSTQFIHQLTNVAVSNFSVATMSGYLFFVVAGFYIVEYPISKKMRYIIYFLGIIGLLIHGYGTYLLSFSSNQIVSTVKGYVNLPCVLYSIAIFVAVRYARIHPLIYKIAQLFEKQTLGIYLLHWFVLEILYINHIPLNKLSDKLIWTIVVFLICWAIGWIIQKIPILNKLV